MLALLGLFAAFLVSGCLHVPPSYGPVAGDCPGQTRDPAGARAPVYFITTDLPECAGDKPLGLSGLRGSFRPYGAAPPDPLRYGVAEAGTPLLPALSLAHAAAWHQRLGQDLAAAGPGRRVLLYVHGYNVAPAEALSAADQIAMAARFQGPVVAFLWPSQNALVKYGWDDENAHWTQPMFDAALADLAGQSDELVLVAHSMGNRIAIEGLRHLQASAPALAARVRIVVLAAPDIDRELFDRDLAPDLVRGGRHVVLFTSGKDLAMRASWAAHGNPRVGDTGCAFAVRRSKNLLEARCYPAPQGGAGALTVIDSTDIEATPVAHSNHIATPEGRAVLREVLGVSFALPGARDGVVVLKPGDAGECPDGAGRLGLTYKVARCEGKR